MKRLFLLFAVALASFAAQSQTTYNASLSGLDTLTNAAADTVTITVGGRKSNVTFQVDVTKISGTVAGTIKYYGSIDGTNYQLLETDSLTDASGIFGYQASYNAFTKYRVIVTTSGTQSSSYNIWALHRN